MKRLLTLFLLLMSTGILGAQEYAVGRIPYETGISPTGGRTVSVPIMTALTLFESEDDNLVLPSDVSVTYTRTCG